MFTKSPNHNINYLATIVDIKEFRPHPKADRLKLATVYGNTVITSISAEPGMYCYFPIESALSKDFLAFTNSFRDKEMNKDNTKTGFFEPHGRIRALKLREMKSEGYIIPISVLEDFVKNHLKKEFVIGTKLVGTDFDTIHDHEICKKYVSRGHNMPGAPGKKTRGNVKKYQSKLVEGQFHFHPDTAQLKRNMGNLSPDDYISVVNKIHGSNFVVSNVLIKRKLSIKERIARFFGVKVEETEYGMLYSSRTVLKNSIMDDGTTPTHYYDADIWKIVADKIFPALKEGISVTGEIVGYTPSGKSIQKSYDYGCQPGELDFYIFKVTYTSAKGDVYIFNHRETVAFCEKHGFKMPETYYYGKAKDHFPELDTTQHWHDNFLNKLMETYMEKKCGICKNDVWAEGVIVRRDIPFDWDVYKLKCFNFLGYESEVLDSGEVDVETEENNNEENSVSE